MTRSPRRTQEARSAATRTLLLDATIACVIEHGYSATTTAVVAERAGVSRGALAHHYTTRGTLVRAAIEHLARGVAQILDDDARSLPSGDDRAAAAVDLLWSRFASPLFPAWLELLVAARTDVELCAAVEPLQHRLRAALDRQICTLFGEVGAAEPELLAVVALTSYLLEGLALEQTLQDEESARHPRGGDRSLDIWKTQASRLLRARPS